MLILTTPMVQEQKKEGKKEKEKRKKSGISDFLSLSLSFILQLFCLSCV
jgi:uncharacterized protein YqhQ